MGDADFIMDECGGFDPESVLPNFMNERASKSYSRPTKYKSKEESKKIFEENNPTNESIEPTKLYNLDFHAWFISGRGEFFLFHKKITQKEFDEMTLKASKFRFTKEDYVEILNRFTEEDYVLLYRWELPLFGLE